MCCLPRRLVYMPEMEHETQTNPRNENVANHRTLMECNRIGRTANHQYQSIWVYIRPAQKRRVNWTRKANKGA